MRCINHGQILRAKPADKKYLIVAAAACREISVRWLITQKVDGYASFDRYKWRYTKSTLQEINAEEEDSKLDTRPQDWLIEVALLPRQSRAINTLIDGTAAPSFRCFAGEFTTLRRKT